MSVNLHIVSGTLIPEISEHIREIFGNVDSPEYYEVAGRVLALDNQAEEIVGHVAWLFRTILIVNFELEDVTSLVVAGIADVYTIPARRRQGIGRALVQRVFEYLGESVPILLFSEPPELSFYERLGIGVCPLKVFYPSLQGVREKTVAMIRNFPVPRRGLIYINGPSF